MRVVLAYLNDAYLDGHFEAVRIDLEGDILSINLARNASGWAALAEETQADLEQIRDEMESMLHRVGSNLDYFGNPAGWVPMLSFEVNKLAFDNETARPGANTAAKMIEALRLSDQAAAAQELALQSVHQFDVTPDLLVQTAAAYFAAGDEEAARKFLFAGKQNGCDLAPMIQREPSLHLMCPLLDQAE